LLEGVTETEKNKDTIEDTNQSRINALKELYRNDRVALVLGAGVSADARIPQWNAFINRLNIDTIKKYIANEKLSDTDLDLLYKLFAKNKDNSPLIQMRYIRSTLNGPMDFKKIVREVLYEENPTVETALLKSISQMCKHPRMRQGVQGIITYNFDDLLEKRLSMDGIDIKTISDETDIVDLEKLNIHHVHGYLPKESKEIEKANLVFSEEDYHDVYTNAYHWSNLSQLTYFREHTCLFIGCSLSDPNLRRLLDVASKPQGDPQHFAIMKRKNVILNKELQDEIGNITDNVINIHNDVNNRINNLFYLSLGIQVIWVEDCLISFIASL